MCERIKVNEITIGDIRNSIGRTYEARYCPDKQTIHEIKTEVEPMKKALVRYTIERTESGSYNVIATIYNVETDVIDDKWVKAYRDSWSLDRIYEDCRRKLNELCELLCYDEAEHRFGQIKEAEECQTNQ
ncbi:hypothetical protein [Halalkalibacter urbisdiaboli]|uniref:hypothetical protein n=1 Tax=Halalkalibacter urbisdiaboli TaxID=1960589 RepID=UPI000B42EC24|nr:hypothetical protein [Halalkalibacter urbisdiaboli]